MILNRDCFFYKKSDFINRQSEISPDSIVYIADTHQIYTHGAFFECALTTQKVKELIENYGYLTPADLPELTGGSAPLEGTYIDGVTVGGHNINIHRGNFSEINVGSATKLENSRDIILSGDISGQVLFDGTKDVTIETTVHNSETADRLTNARAISLTGQASGLAYFDGSKNISIETTTNQLNSINANNQDLNNLVTLNGYLGNLFYGAGGNTSANKPDNTDSFGLFTFKSASGNYTTQILGNSLDRIYARSGADSALGNWNTIAYLTDNVASATKLENTRTFTISDGQHTGSSSNFDGTGNVVLDLPDIINADIIGDLTGDITGNVTGDLYGNADTATKLETGRNINGTLFDGTKDIITNQWGTTRNIGIVNSDGSGTPIPVSVNGGNNVNLKLPATIKADITGDLNGNASTASKLQTPVDINLSGDATGTVSFDGSKDVTINVDVNTASKLENEFTLTLGGDTTGSVSIDGSKNVTLSVTVKDNSHNHTVSNITDLNSTWDKYLTGGGLYERNLVMNGTTYPVFTDVSGASTMTWYAPTTAGTSGYILQSTGGTPQWISISTLGSLLDDRYVNVSGDTMTGGLTLPGGQSSAFNSQGLMFSGNTGHIGTDSSGNLGIYAKNDIYIRPDSSTSSSSTGLYISSDVITYNNYPLLHSNNYTDYVYSKSQSDNRYIKDGGGVDSAYIRYAGINGANYNFLSNVNSQYPFMIYAPTSAGTSAYILQSTGGTPTWISRSTLQHQLFSAGAGCDPIPANADLNNYRTPGNYYCSYNATVQTIANTPSDYAFNLMVLEAAGVIQIYREYGYASNAKEFTRRYYNDTWTPWVQTPQMTDIYTWTDLDDRYVKKAGDTMTGNLTLSNSGLYLNSNGVTSHIKSENSSWLHFYTDAASGFYFDTDVTVLGEIYAGSDYKQLVWNAGNDGSGSGLDADLLDGYHRSTLFQGTSAWFDATTALTKSITISGNSDTYYPVVIQSSSDKRLPTYISIWKNLSSPTPDIPGNHDGGTSSLWLIYEGRSTTWDGNGGFYRLKYKSQPYGTLVAHASYSTKNNGGLIVWLRGGGCQYNITCTNTFSAPVYLSSTNIGSESYPENIEPKTAVDNGGVINGIFYGNASSATKLQTARNITLSGDVTGSASFDGSKNITINTTLVNGYATEDWVNSQGFLKNDTNTTYTLSQSGNTIFLSGSDGSTSSVSISQSVSTTYTLTKSGNNIILRGSDGSESSVVDSNTTYDLSDYATVDWVSNNFDSVSISRDQTSGVRIAVINVSGTNYSLYAPTAGEVSLTWDSISGKPSCFTPCEHGHHFDDITFNNTGTNAQYLAGDGRFYTIRYSEISGTPASYSLPILSNNTLGGAKVNLKHTSSCTFESSHTSTSTSVSINSRTAVSGRYYAVEADSNGYLFVNVPWEAGESGGGITSINDAAGSSTATGYLITDASGSTVYRRALNKKDITDALEYTPPDTDTKNTAGSTNSTSKLYLIGAREQNTNPVTYSESGCYISGGQLYSDGELVATQSWVESNISIDFSMSSTDTYNLSLTINGTTNRITNLYADTVDGYDISVVSTTPSTMLTSTIYFVY